MTSHSFRGWVFVGTSLDGFIARPDGDLEWLTDPAPDPGTGHDRSHTPGQDGNAGAERPTQPPAYEEFMAGIDHLVMGRGTYEKILTFDTWPYADKHVIVLGSTMVIATAPVLLGSGIRLFGALGADVLLEHVGTSYGDSGMVSSHYCVVH